MPRRIACAVGIDAVQRQREPDRQSSGTPGELVAEIARVVRIVTGAQHIDVRTVLGVHLSSEIGFAIDQRARAARREQPLVRIDDERVGTIQPGEPVAQLRQQQRRQAVGAVDVEPRADLCGDVGTSGQIVDHSCVRRAARGDDDADVGAITDRRRAVPRR